MADLEIRELRYVQAVAAELSFTRAAERLGIAQPPLSRAIRRLERRLGTELFDRGPHHVALTEAGRTLAEEADAILDAAASAVVRTRAAGQTRPALVITAKPGVAACGLRHLLDAYRRLPDAVEVDVAVGGYNEAIPMLLDGRADLALIGSPQAHPGLDTEPLTHEPRVAALPVDHPLAVRESLTCRDLRGEPVPRCVGAEPSEAAYWAAQDRELAGADEAEIASRLVFGPEVHDSSQVLEVIALGQAISVIPVSAAELNRREDLAFVPVTDASEYTVSIAWLAGSRDRRIAHVVRAATNWAATVNTATAPVAPPAAAPSGGGATGVAEEAAAAR